MIMSAMLGLQKYKYICSINSINIDENFHAACMQIAVLMQSDKQYKIYLVPIDKLSFRTAVL